MKRGRERGLWVTRTVAPHSGPAITAFEERSAKGNILCHSSPSAFLCCKISKNFKKSQASDAISRPYLRRRTVAAVLADSSSIVDFPTIEHGHVIIAAVVVSLNIKLFKL